MTDDFSSWLTALTGASRVLDRAPVQSLWSGYGQILRCTLDGCEPGRVIAKHVRWPTQRDHPRGWSSHRSHLRKVRSYEVETHWYQHYAARCSDASRVPRCLAVEHRDDEVLMVLEDLDASGFPARRTHLSDREIDACLAWLAAFHATFMGESPVGLWNVGTYWHLDTRPDELAAMASGPLKEAARAIDERLSDAAFKTFVHGDAKVANFCFSTDGAPVAAVDFQYVGGGCGMKDVAYFVGSCLDEDECERKEAWLLSRYFSHLASALASAKKDVDFAALEAEWRMLYPVAWTDFYRFLAGWSPGHWKMHAYSERLAREVVASL